MRAAAESPSGRSEHDAARVSVAGAANSFRRNLASSTGRALCRMSRGAAVPGGASSMAAKDAKVLASAVVLAMPIPPDVGLGWWCLAGLVTIEV